MSKPLLLYSANTWLSYRIAEYYYRQEHHIWCAPVFDSRSIGSIDMVLPPTSSPFEIYRSLYEETRRGDRHSSKIATNKLGILQGAKTKRSARVITLKQEKEITTIVESAEVSDFRPLLYIMPFELVQKLLIKVPVADRAHPLSNEFLIDALPRTHFDVIQFNIGV
ncbi:MAG TPA: hypothetical protein VI636_17995 [Candidatus Angelobacter sp.]